MTIFLLCFLLKSRRSFTEHSTSEILLSAQKFRNVNSDMTIGENKVFISVILTDFFIHYLGFNFN